MDSIGSREWCEQIVWTLVQLNIGWSIMVIEWLAGLAHNLFIKLCGIVGQILV